MGKSGPHSQKKNSILKSWLLRACLFFLCARKTFHILIVVFNIIFFSKMDPYRLRGRALPPPPPGYGAANQVSYGLLAGGLILRLKHLQMTLLACTLLFSPRGRRKNAFSVWNVHTQQLYLRNGSSLYLTRQKGYLCTCIYKPQLLAGGGGGGDVLVGMRNGRQDSGASCETVTV